MLKTSPILSPSSASPSSFHNASRSSQGSVSSHPSQLPSMSPKPAYVRRLSSQSTTTVSATASSSALSPGRSRRTGASHSDTRTPSRASISTSPSPAALPTTTTKMTVTTTTKMGVDDETQDPGRHSPAQAQLYNALSPNKRRLAAASTTPDASSAPPAVAPASGPPQQAAIQQSAKRAKPEERPPIILPQKYEHCPVEHMVELIAHMLGELIATNDAIRISSGGLTRFHSRTPPGISVRDYLHRLARHATLIPPLLLAMVYYIDRLCALYPEFTINTLTVHRFLITAATVAAKGLSDSFWNNTTYARVGGVRVAELRLLELEFLYRVDWRIVPNPEILVAYYQGLVQRCPGYELESDGSSEIDDDDEIDDDEDEDDEE
ncbi:cyclin domain-containing protein [Trichoderma longibrachiatum]|uniref:Cyclin-domain-containing protein n=1 Tax=Trichoderma longibrachiatum ATCC 18648 TaxID=983965 RepID=A0A2T4BV61_TRILO|nr:cyclin-domain-containing protein [Trichoderma longibrachiatum ATCC 18648]